MIEHATAPCSRRLLTVTGGSNQPFRVAGAGVEYTSESCVLKLRVGPPVDWNVGGPCRLLPIALPQAEAIADVKSYDPAAR